MNFHRLVSRTLNYHIFISYKKIKYASIFTMFGYYCKKHMDDFNKKIVHSFSYG